MTPAASTDGAPSVIVVGSGIAGLVAALHAAAAGCRVTVVTKDELAHANTRYAQGGIAAVMFDDDRLADHERDTLVAGAGLADPEAVHVLVSEGPTRVRELIDLGVSFDRAADGAFVKGLEGAHSYPRILHAGGDATGIAIERALVGRLLASGVAVREHAFLVDLVVEEGRAAGVLLLENGQTRRLDADAVVLATGGAGMLYSHTTNPEVATGDGIAAALRAGAEVVDLEFVQFHPTVLPAVGGRDPFLISEAVRGEGAILVDDAGRRFCLDAHPDAELAPRDVVARAIAEAMARQGGRPVHLDATRLFSPDPSERAHRLAERFPTIDAALRDRGLEWAIEPIPVTPAAHYLMGGVTVDLFGRTSLPGLYAVGEAARTGVHGANRLASNSLLEGAVFGARAGDAIRSDLERPSTHGWPAWSGRPAAPPIPVAVVDAPPFSREALRELMWTHAGLVRTEAELAAAAAILSAWRRAAPAPTKLTDLEDANLLLVAERLVAAARARRQSVGAHVRADEARSEAPAGRVVAAC